ncbi:transporter [Neolewinella persica]|uniref:transporter n=1 Tax=Neolewinella persica TaxID=70998 RepID=UPI000475E5F7|nr:transporter [Neolewinella persica]
MLSRFSQLTLLLAALCSMPLCAQGVVDGFFHTEGRLSLTAGATRGTFDDFYVGEELSNPVPVHGKITQIIYNVYGKYGITDNLNLIVNVPFIDAEGAGPGDPINGEQQVSGLQDVTIMAHYRPFSTSFSGGQFDGLASAGVSLPGGYEPNGILSIGSGAFAADLKIGGHLQLTSGVFATAIAGYSLRGSADDTFGVIEGESFDVPNAINLMAKLGYAGGFFYVDGWIDYQSSSDGVDIMGPGFTGNFPETKVDYTRVGLTGYMPINHYSGISVSYGSVISGRNLGKTTYLNAGLTIVFNEKKSE